MIIIKVVLKLFGTNKVILLVGQLFCATTCEILYVINTMYYENVWVFGVLETTSLLGVEDQRRERYY